MRYKITSYVPQKGVESSNFRLLILSLNATKLEVLCRFPIASLSFASAFLLSFQLEYQRHEATSCAANYYYYYHIYVSFR